MRESSVSLARQIRDVATLLFLRNSRHLTTDLTINFACKSRDEFHTCTIQVERLSAEATFRMTAHTVKM